MADDGPQGWSGAIKLLSSAGYNVKPLKLFETGKIPDDANLVIAPGPRLDPLEKRWQSLRKNWVRAFLFC